MKTERNLFLRPVLRGPRFEQHSVPVEVLEEFRIYKDFVIDVAKTLYLKAHPTKTRVPKGFTNGFQLSLEGIEAGSAVSVLTRSEKVNFTDNQELFENDADDDFEKARDLITDYVEAKSNGRAASVDFPTEHLSYFKRFGKTLRPDESFEFVKPGATSGPKYDQSLRRQIMKQVGEDYEEAIELIGTVRQVDTLSNSFQLVTKDGLKIECSFPKDIESDVTTAAKQYRSLELGLEGTALLSSNGNLKRVQQIERVYLTDKGPDFDLRLQQLAEILPGWLDGAGEPVEPSLLEKVGRVLREVIDEHNVRLPYLYPTPEGGVQAEWELDNGDVEIEFSPLSSRVAAQAESKLDGEWEEKVFDLDSEQFVKDIAMFINKREL